MEVKETLTLDFVFLIGQYVRIKDDAHVSKANEWAIGMPLKIIGYMAQGDENGDDFFYKCVPASKDNYNIAFLREDVLKPIKIKEKKDATAKDA